MVRVQAYCMQFIKNSTQGVSKNEEAKNEKMFDLDRKRDDESIIDVQSLKDPDYQISKKTITFYDTDEIELLWHIDDKASTFKWENDGELHITMPKLKSNKVQYWQRLEKTPNTTQKVQVWWDMKDEHVDNVEDLAVDERKAGLHKDEL